jgi:putative ATP-binding cassette transporter
MNLFRLLRRAPAVSLAYSLSLCLLAPVFLVLAYLLGSGWLTFPRGIHSFATFALAAALLAVNALLQSHAMSRLSADAYEAISRVRAETIRLATVSEVDVMRGVGPVEIASVVDADARVVAAAVPTLMDLAICVGWVLAAVVLGAVDSWLVIAAYAAAMVLVHLALTIRGRVEPERLGEEAEGRFRAIVDDLLSSPRSLVVDRKKAGALADAAAVEARDVAAQRIHGSKRFVWSLASAEAALQFAFLGAHEVARSGYAGARDSANLMLLLAVTVGPVIRLFHSRFQLAGANGGARRLLALEAGLRVAPRVPPARDTIATFSELRLEAVSLTRAPRADEPPFTLGPIDLAIRPGTVTVIRGPNGSGKSTLLDVLLGFIRPDAGRLVVDDRVVDTGSIDAWRGLFSVVFANPHLFDRMYGHEDGVAEANAWLDVLGLAEVRADADRHTSDRLSTGQRKRLALARALAERRPVLVLDEYTADQDPAARDHFFSVVLPRLKAEGRTVVAVIHGASLPDCADRVIGLADGRLVADARDPLSPTKTQAHNDEVH